MRPPSHDRQSVERDEVLEALWTAGEAGVAVTVSNLADRVHLVPVGEWEPLIERLRHEGLISTVEGTLGLTGPGQIHARGLIRRHRLAEVLFGEVLDLPMEDTERTACGVEHVLSNRAADAVCSFLGHPTVCPHGHSIPPGECCARAGSPVRPILSRLSQLEPGVGASIALLAPRAGQPMDQLIDLGLVPGARVAVHQRHPSLVIAVGHTMLAVDREIADRIFVRPGSPDVHWEQ